MRLIQMLQEASSIGLDDLKKAMQRDKLAALVFKKDLKVDDIPSKEAFLSSLKYYFFNNERVREFIQARHGVKNISAEVFARFRKLQHSELDQATLERIKNLIQDVFREHKFVLSSGMTKEIKDVLNKWFNNNSGYSNLPAWAIQELDSLPVKPDKPVVVYRGLLFSEASLKDYHNYDGTLKEGNGLRFLKSIRKNKRTVDLEWDLPSSWSRSKEIAERFAKYGPASTQFSAVMGWLDRQMKDRAIDGVLGFVISTIAKPSDVLLDTEKFNSTFHMQHGNEAEIILKPGKYLCRVVKKFTVEGEVDLDSESAVEDSVSPKIAEAIEKTSSFKETFNISGLIDELGSDRWIADAASLVRNWDILKKLVLNSSTTQIIHAYDKAIDFYKSALSQLTEYDLRIDKFIEDSDQLKKISALREIYKWFNEKVPHSKFKNEKTNSKQTGPRWQLNAEEYRNSFNSYDINDMERALLIGNRISSQDAGNSINTIAILLGINVPKFARVHTLSAEKQKELIDKIVTAFLNKLGLEPSENRIDNIKTFINLLKKAYRNSKMLSELAKLQNKLSNF